MKNKKSIVKTAVNKCGKGGPLVNAAQRIENGVGHITSNAVKGYKEGGIIQGISAAGKGMADNFRSNMRGLGSVAKTLGGGVEKGISAIVDKNKKVQEEKDSRYTKKLNGGDPYVTTRPKLPIITPKTPQVKPAPQNELRDSMPLKAQTSMPIKEPTSFPAKIDILKKAITKPNINIGNRNTLEKQRKIMRENV